MNESAILAELACRRHAPPRPQELARALGLERPDQQEALERLLERLETDGRVVCLRDGRYAVPEIDRLVVGHVELKRGRAGAQPARKFAFILPTSDSLDDVYVGARDLGNAFHGDLVAVQIRPRRGRRPRRSGRVVRVIRRASERVVGVFTPAAGSVGGSVLPDESALDLAVTIPKGRTAGAKPGEKVVVRITSFPEGDEAAAGEILERLGPTGTWRVELAATIERFALRTEFPPAALEQARAARETIAPAEWEQRADYRELLTVAIDPDDAKDRDDAISLVRESAGGWTLRVHIADVSHYVVEDGPIDREARLRATSVYLPGKHVPMLPERLCADVCSLHEGLERRATTVTIRFDGQGEALGSTIERSVIRSDHSLSYRGVREMIEGEIGGGRAVSGPLLTLLAEAKELSQILRARRIQRGSLDLELPEARVILDEADEVVAVELLESDWTHQLVEEFMLAANCTVAAYAVDHRVPSLYRVHESPEEESLRQFAQLASTLGYPLRPPVDRRKLQRVIDAARGSRQGAAVQYALLRSLKQARYAERCADHYALAFSRYCHFTSPIRRYPDLVTHRALAECFPPGQSALPEAGPRRGGKRARSAAERVSELAHLARHASRMERVAAAAEQSLKTFRQMEFLKAHEADVYGGIITDVRPFGIFVELDAVHVSGLVPIERLLDDEYVYDAHARVLRGRRRSSRYRIADAVKVRVRHIDLGRRRVDLDLFYPDATFGPDAHAKPRRSRRGRKT